MTRPNAKLIADVLNKENTLYGKLFLVTGLADLNDTYAINVKHEIDCFLVDFRDTQKILSRPSTADGIVVTTDSPYYYRNNLTFAPLNNKQKLALQRDNHELHTVLRKGIQQQYSNMKLTIK